MTKVNIRKAMQANSNQLNAEDLACPRTIKILGIYESDGRIHIDFGDKGRPWILSKTALRTLAQCWGDEDPDKWIGMHCTIYNDPTVKWAGKEVGGIRVSHVEGISRARTFNLSVARGKKKPTTIEPLVIEAKSVADKWKAGLFRVVESDEKTIENSWKEVPADIKKELGGQDFYEQLIEMEKAAQEHAESDDAVVDDLNAQFAAE